jgi:lysozyme
MRTDIYQKMVESIKSDEAYRRFPYTDSVGKLTIGYGRNLKDVGIMQKEADYLLYNDILEAANLLQEKITFFNDLDSVRKAVLIEMTLNMGIGEMIEFKKMLQALKVKDYVLAAKEMMNSFWAKEVHTRADHLAKRMETGEM